MHDQIRPVAGPVRPPAWVSCLSWSLDGQVPAFLFLPYEQSTADLRVHALGTVSLVDRTPTSVRRIYLYCYFYNDHWITETQFLKRVRAVAL